LPIGVRRASTITALGIASLPEDGLGRGRMDDGVNVGRGSLVLLAHHQPAKHVAGKTFAIPKLTRVVHQTAVNDASEVHQKVIQYAGRVDG